MARIVLSHICLSLATVGMTFGETLITGPVAGYVSESSPPRLRAIVGVPGSFRFSNPLELAFDVTKIHIAPGHHFALVERKDTTLGVLQLTGGTHDHVAAIDGALATPDWVAFSPGARSVILYSASSCRLQVLGDLPDRPRVVWNVDATLLPEQPVMGAVTEDTRILLVASNRVVYRVLPEATVQQLFSGNGIVSLVMLRNGHHVAVSERGSEAVYVLQDITSAYSIRTLASGLESPGEIFPSWDGAKLFVASPGEKTVRTIDLASGEIQSLALDTAPVSLLPLRNYDTFLISAKRDEPAWIFYRDGDVGRLVFSPAPQK